MQIIEDNPIDLKTKYNQSRILSLEKLVLSGTSLDTIKEYEETIVNIILSDNDIPEREKNMYINMVQKQFGD